MLTVEKLIGGYVVSHDDSREIVSAGRVASLIMRFWPDVMECIQELQASHAAATDTEDTDADPQPDHPSDASLL